MLNLTDMTKISVETTVIYAIMPKMDDLDRQLIQLLENDARMPAAELARRLHLSRSTVQDRLRRLEERGIIGGYTIRFKDSFVRRHITAHVLISINPKLSDKVVRDLKRMSSLRSLHAVSGVYDLVALLREETTEAMDATLDAIGRIEGIERTMTSIVLSTKFER